MIHFNLGSHNPDLSRNHKVIDELLDLVVSTEVSTERAAFTTSSAAHGEQRDSATESLRHTPSLETEPQIHLPVGQSEERNSVCELPEAKPALSEPFIPKTLSPEELAQADEAFHFDLRSDFDQMYGREEFEEEACD